MGSDCAGGSLPGAGNLGEGYPFPSEASQAQRGQTPPLENKDQSFSVQRDSVQRYSLTPFG